MEQGYIKIHRSLVKKGYYKDSHYVHLWIHLIMKATYQEKEYLFNGKIHMLKPGQFITGRNTLSAETGINRSKIERMLKTFENEQQIEQQMTTKFRIISILSWDKYQNIEHQNEPRVSHERATSEPRVSTNKKEKKEKKEKNIYIYSQDFESWYQNYPNKIAKKKAHDAWNSKNGSRPDVEILLKHLTRQTEERERAIKEKRFVPEWCHPATYINQERWEDVYYSETQQGTHVMDKIEMAARGLI
jgi:hypothetical protein